MNQLKGRTKDRSRSKCVGYSVPALLYSVLLYYVHPVYGSLCFKTKSAVCPHGVCISCDNKTEALSPYTVNTDVCTVGVLCSL